MTETARIREIVTPEGVAVPFEVASPVDRLAAFAVDFFLVHVVVVAIAVLGFVSSRGDSGGHGMSLALLSSFFLRNFYFTYFEVRWSGATIGKRKLGLRVISRDGGPLTTEAVFARNLTREVEVFLPLVALISPQVVLPGLPVWAAVIGLVWLLIFAVLPLLGRDHLRIGDMLGGTLVVRMPEARLMEDLAVFHAGAFSGRGVRPADEERYRFTRDQLDLYGIKELQVLEDLLRRSQGIREMDVVEAVAERIKKKILWPREQWKTDDWAFLSAFYKAQRARLEHKMLFGKRQKEKKK